MIRQTYHTNGTLLFSSRETLAIKLAIQSSPKSIKIPILSQQQVMVPSRRDLLHLQAICVHLNRLLCMQVQRIGYAKLSIIIVAHREDPPALRQEESVELATRNLLDWLASKVRLLTQYLLVSFLFGICYLLSP